VAQYVDVYRSSARPSSVSFTTLAPASIAVLLASHNRREKTLACLAGLHAAVIPGINVVIHLVDDASTDGTVEAVTSVFPNVKVSVGSGDLYWGGGMRLAFEQALPTSPDFLLWLNDDVVLEQDALVQLLSTYANLCALRQPLTIVVGSTCDSQSGSLTYGGVERKSRLRRMKFSLVEPTNIPLACETMNGNVVFIPRSVYSVVGNIDEKFTHAMGDFDYGLRARSAGFKAYVAPGYVGTCSVNPRENTFRDAILSRRERFRRATTTKGLPFIQWAIMCRRHAGPLWPAYAISPYIRIMLGRSK
jgi:GT2 family glycosyltransferase